MGGGEEGGGGGSSLWPGGPERWASGSLSGTALYLLKKGGAQPRLGESVVEGSRRSVHTGARAKLSCSGDKATATLLVAVLLSLLTLTAAYMKLHMQLHMHA